MNVIVRKYEERDLPAMLEIWNKVVEAGEAFPQESSMSADEAKDFFAAQSYCGVADLDGEVVGLYIMHPNNVGHCGHIANASFAVKEGRRGMQIGTKLVIDCLEQGKALDFHILQFNAVVADNESAIHLYEKLGFKQIGRVCEGFKSKSGEYKDILLFYHEL